MLARSLKLSKLLKSNFSVFPVNFPFLPLGFDSWAYECLRAAASLSLEARARFIAQLSMVFTDIRFAVL